MIPRQLMPRLCPLCPSSDGIDVSHNQASTAITKVAGFECDLLHIAELNSFAPPVTSTVTGAPRRGPSLENHRFGCSAAQIKGARSLACSRALRNNGPWRVGVGCG